MKNFFNSFGCSNIFYHNLDFTNINVDFRFLYLLNLTLEELEDTSFIILFNTNLRLENPLLNSRLRKNYLKSRSLPHRQFTVLSFGQAINYAGYPVINVSNNLKAFLLFIQGKYYFFNNIFFNPSNFRSLSFFNIFLPYHLKPALLVGATALASRIDFSQTLQAALIFVKILEKHSFLTKKIFNSVSSHLGEISLKELGLTNRRQLNISQSLRYFIGTDKIESLSSKDLVVYQGSHMPSHKALCDRILFLPTTAYTERVSTYMNMEGRIRLTKVAIAAPKLVLSDTEVLRLLNLLKRKNLPNNLSHLDDFYEVTNFFKFLIDYGYSPTTTLRKFYDGFSSVSGFKLRAFYNVSPSLMKPYNIEFHNYLFSTLKCYSSTLPKVFVNYYATDFLSRNSKIMSICSTRVLLSNFSEKC